MGHISCIRLYNDLKLNNRTLSKRRNISHFKHTNCPISCNRFAFLPSTYFSSNYTKIIFLFPKFRLVWIGFGNFTTIFVCYWINCRKFPHARHFPNEDKSDCTIVRNTWKTCIIGWSARDIMMTRIFNDSREIAWEYKDFLGEFYVNPWKKSYDSPKVVKHRLISILILIFRVYILYSYVRP